MNISIHSSHTGRDRALGIIRRWMEEFQSTLPIREETYWRTAADLRAAISIHSSHPGRDMSCPGVISSEHTISIHSSHTGRDPPEKLRRPATAQFQSTLPIREETLTTSRILSCRTFQSTLPIRDETAASPICCSFTSFQSTLPIREETEKYHV